MLYREIIAVCSEIHTKPINALWGQDVEFVLNQMIRQVNWKTCCTLWRPAHTKHSRLLQCSWCCTRWLAGCTVINGTNPSVPAQHGSRTTHLLRDNTKMRKAPPHRTQAKSLLAHSIMILCNCSGNFQGASVASDKRTDGISQWPSLRWFTHTKWQITGRIRTEYLSRFNGFHCLPTTEER
jgi:hypothetical protein